MMRYSGHSRRQITVLLIAVTIMAFIGSVVVDERRPYSPRQGQVRPEAVVAVEQEIRPVLPPARESKALDITEVRDFKTAALVPPEQPPAPPPPETAPAPAAIPEAAVLAPPAPDPKPAAVAMPQDLPPAAAVQLWKVNAVPYQAAPGQPRIAIIIDDMGMDHRHTAEASALPGPLTMSFLPYAEHVGAQAAKARAAGHELMVHVPMEPMDGALDAGPAVLKTGMAAEDFKKVLDADLAAFEGYTGINNHMGSRLTQDPAAMAAVMAELRRRGLMFVDSKTISNSVGAETAKAYRIPYGARDIFLDHEETLEFARAALVKLEHAARAHGSAIAIGHPKAVTIQALKEWLPTLKEKGIALVPASAVVRPPSADEAPAPAAAIAASHLEPASP